MKTTETIEVYIDYKDGQTVCMCKKAKKLCSKQCKEDVVLRDLYRGWKETMNGKYK